MVTVLWQLAMTTMAPSPSERDALDAASTIPLGLDMSEINGESNGASHVEWPNVVAESSGLLFDSIFMYALPDLQALARKELLKDGDANVVVSYPIKTVDILNVIMKNREAIQKHFKPGDAKLYGTALFLARENIDKMPHGKEAVLQSQLVFFDDKDQNKELVYGISKCDITKRITVAFRGSATIKDLEIDTDGYIVNRNNPLNPNSKEKLGVHQGFHYYLNGNPRGGKSLDEVNKYSEIMSELSVLYEKYPGYMLYVTGHSLGASLAQLFAMEAAACQDEFIPKPVTTINFASPKVGDIHFRNCFEALEDKGLLRCLRFRNDKDIVPTLPDRENCSCIRTIRCQPSVYRHAGPSIALFPDGSFEVCYEYRDKETVCKFVKEAAVTSGHGLGFAVMVPTLLRFGKNFLTYHSCAEYMKRFRAFANNHGGNKVHLNDIYKNEAQLTKLLEGGFKK